MTANKCVLAALWPGRGDFVFKAVSSWRRYRLSFPRGEEFRSVTEMVRVFRSRKYLMVIERDYTGYYNHWPPVRVFSSDGMYPPSSSWKREAFHLGCIRCFQEGLLSAADAKNSEIYRLFLFGERFNLEKVMQQRERRKKVALQGRTRRIAVVVIGVFCVAAG